MKDENSFSDEILAQIPDSVREAVKYPEGAMGAFLSVILDGDIEVREQELDYIETHMDINTFDEANIIAEELDELPLEVREPIARMAVPMLRTLSKEDYLAFRKDVFAIMDSEEKTEFIDLDCCRELMEELDGFFGIGD